MGLEENMMQYRFKVGIFAILGLLLMGAISVYVNDRPFWWRSCQLVHVSVEDATGLKRKSPVRSLGLDIGYLDSVELFQENVKLGICITAPVEVLPTTRAYIRAEGFLGDKFVELKPVQYTGEREKGDAPIPPGADSKEESSQNHFNVLRKVSSFLFRSAWAESPKNAKEIPVGEASQDISQLVTEVDKLVVEMTELTTNLKQAINPQELKAVLKQLNTALENAAQTLSPEGGLTSTAQRALAKLEDSIEQLRDILTRINQGKGSVGMMINDPIYAEEAKKAMKNLNRLLNKASDMRFVVNLGAEKLFGYSGTRGKFELGVWPSRDRYYLLGATIDTRGKISTVTTTTKVGGVSTTTERITQEKGGLQLTLMLGKVFWNWIDLSVGFHHGDASIRSLTYLGWDPEDREQLQLLAEAYFRTPGDGSEVQMDARIQGIFFPIRSELLSSVYFLGGMEGFRKVGGKTNLSLGAGLMFDDEDIKFLFTLL